jgi:hypothetical protein
MSEDENHYLHLLGINQVTQTGIQYGHMKSMQQT